MYLQSNTIFPEICKLPTVLVANSPHSVLFVEFDKIVIFNYLKTNV